MAICKDSDIDKLAADKITADADETIYKAGGGLTDSMCFTKKAESRDSVISNISFKTDKGTTLGCGKNSFEFYGTTKTSQEFKADAGKYIKGLKQSNDPRSFKITGSVDAANN
jgi:hypothetical protein